jgi:hypothetical protein
MILLGWFFTILHVGIALVVLLTLVLVPPRWQKSRKMN